MKQYEEAVAASWSGKGRSSLADAGDERKKSKPFTAVRTKQAPNQDFTVDSKNGIISYQPAVIGKRHRFLYAGKDKTKERDYGIPKEKLSA